MSNFFNHTNEVYTNTVKPTFFTSAGTISRGSDIKEDGKSKTLKLKVCHPHCVKSIIQCIYCVYIYIYMQSKTQQFVR